MSGVWNWRGRVGKTTNDVGRRQDVKGVIPGFDLIEWKGRSVHIIFDANVSTNESVQAARRALAAELTKRGAKVTLVDLPEAQGVNGVDDLLALKGADYVLGLLDIRSEQRDERDLMLAATNSWVVALDNLSRLPTWFSDALCRLATGGGFATRTLYENDEETLFTATRPIITNGIEELATRSDLLDRSVIVNLPAIPPEKRKTEAEFRREFEFVRPFILGSVLGGVSQALRNVDTVQLEQKPRMADFAA